MKREQIKEDLRVILYKLEDFLKSYTTIGDTLNQLKILKDDLIDFSNLIHQDKPLKECIEDFWFYNPDFDVTHIDLLSYGLYDDLEEVPLDLFYKVRTISLNVKNLFEQL